MQAAVELELWTSDGRTRGAVMVEQLMQRRVVCVGEAHPELRHHYAQLWIVDQMLAQARAANERTAVGLEMFDRTQQLWLERYASGTFAEAEFLEGSGYLARWGYDFDLYRPALERGRELGAALLGLNAPRQWTRRVAATGLAGVDSELLAQFPELDLDDADHRQFFRSAMSAHPMPAAKETPAHEPSSAHEQPHEPDQTTALPPTGPFAPELERYYQAQVLWDETMAESASRWLQEAPSTSRLVILAGQGHCRRSAIPKRIERRTGLRVWSLAPVDEPSPPSKGGRPNPGTAAGATVRTTAERAHPEERPGEAFDGLIVLSPRR